MSSAEDCLVIETESLKKYLESSNKKLINSVEGEGIIGGGKKHGTLWKSHYILSL